MIKIGDNPEGSKGVNKFIAPCGEGQRGVVIAMKKGKKEAIILAKNSSTTRDVLWGRTYLVKEDNPKRYPIVVSESYVPDTPEWKILI